MVFGTLGQPVGIGCLRSQREKMALLQSSVALSGFPSSSSSSSFSQLQGRFKSHAFNHKAKAFKTRRVSPRAALLELKPPPYAFDALEPLMSKRTFEFHWGKHHRAYVDNCNNQIKGTELESLSLPDIVTRSYNHGDPLPVFNNAAQAWNHEFFWESMKPGGGKEPSGKVLEKITSDFGSYEEFVKQFKQAAATQFGSGWAWLVLKDQKFAIEKTPNAVNPLVFGHTPLLTIDVWEHAYYLDYQNRRPDYITTFVNELISWDSVTARLDAA